MFQRRVAIDITRCEYLFFEILRLLIISFSLSLSLSLLLTRLENEVTIIILRYCLSKYPPYKTLNATFFFSLSFKNSIVGNSRRQFEHLFCYLTFVHKVVQSFYYHSIVYNVLSLFL